MSHQVVDRRPVRRVQVAPGESNDSTKRGMSYVPHAHGRAEGGPAPERVFCGLATARPLPVGIVEREMHCRVSSEGRKCTDAGCLAMLVIGMALWAGAAVFVIPRSDWRRLVYGSDSLGRTCGEGVWADRKRLYFPSVQSDLLALQANATARGDTLTLGGGSGGSALDVYGDLTSVCVEECPTAGDVVCMLEFLGNFSTLPNASTVAQCYGGAVDSRSPTGLFRNTFFMDNYEFCMSCWLSALNTTDVFFHCVPDQPLTTGGVSKRCTFPDNPADELDGDHLAPDDPRCLVVSETVTVDSSAPADLAATTGITFTASALAPGGKLDPVADALAAAVTGLPGLCLDVINTYAIMLGVAPVVSGLVCFLSLASIGRACKRNCRCTGAGNSVIGVAGAVGAAGPQHFCSASAMFVWAFLCLGLVLSVTVSGFAWLKTGLFNLDAAAALLDNTSDDLDETISSALGGFRVNVTALGLDLFSGSLTELAGVQVAVDANETVWRIVAFVSLLFCFLAMVAVFAFRRKVQLAIRVVDEASVPVRKHVGLLFLPIVAAMFSVAAVVWLLYLGVMLVSVNDFQLGNVSAAVEDLINSFSSCSVASGSNASAAAACPSLITFPSYELEFTDLRTFFVVFHVLMFLWVAEINYVLANLITAGAVADWYWTRSSGPGKKPDPDRATKGGDGDSLLAPVWNAIVRTWQFHLGTAALGAAVLPLCYPAWVVLHYLETLMHHVEQTTKCARNLRRCLQAVMCCFTKCLKLFHRDAYALVAMQGHGFFDSCYHAADILDAPFEQIAAFKNATVVVFNVAKWTVAALCGLMVYLTLYFEVNVTLGFPSATSNVVPSFVAGLIGFMVARCFFDVYVTAVGTVLVCFCEDALVHNIDRNDPTERHEEVFMPSSLVHTAFTVTERRNYGFYTHDDVLQIKQDIELLKALRNSDGVSDAVAQVCTRHNYQIKAPVTADKLINTLKQEAHEALAGASHQSYTIEQIQNIGRIKHGVDLRKGIDVSGHKSHSVQGNSGPMIDRVHSMQVATGAPKVLRSGGAIGPDDDAPVDFI